MTPIEIQRAIEERTAWRPLDPEECCLCGHKAQAVWTLAEFCSHYRMSRQTFYELRDKPVFMKIGGRIRITSEDVAEWEKRQKSSPIVAVSIAA